MKRKATVALIVGVVVAGIVGIGGGAAVAYIPVLLAPAGLTATDGTNTAPMPDPTYKTNSQGLTYGSAAEANSPANEPDMIAVIATNDRKGYVNKVDLENADGTAAARAFKSPEDALNWQETEGKLDHFVPVYDVDGQVVIGEFLVAGSQIQNQNSGK